MIRNKEDSVESIVKLIFKFCIFTTFSIPLTIINISNRLFPQRKNLNGKLVLIISNGSQLNRNLALQLAGLGCDIAFVDPSTEFAKQTVFEVNVTRKSLAKAYIDFNTSDSDDIKRLYAEVSRDFGNIDILINNADYSDEQNVNEMIHVNVYGAIMISEKFLECGKFSKNEGHIVLISSISGLFPSSSAITYSCTKSSTISYMIGLNEKIRKDEMMCDRIKTTCVCLNSTNGGSESKSDNLEVAEVASRIITAIIEEENFVTIPNYLGTLARCVSLLPLNVQQLARELFLRDSNF